MNKTRLEALGWTPAWAAHYESLELGPSWRPARISVEYQDRVRVEFDDGHADAFLVGRLRDVTDRLDRPAVGDWVAVRQSDSDDLPMVGHLLPRRSVFIRRAAGNRDIPQILAANIDRVFIVTSLNREFNPRRLERYIAAVHASGAVPVLVLNKADLVDASDPFVERLDPELRSLDLVVTSAESGVGIDRLREEIRPGQTVAFSGSSGVGKSTLLNVLLGREAMATGDVRAVDDAGRHTTRNRTLLTFPGGGVLIDTPGMRELQLWATPDRVSEAFGDIEERAEDCKFRNCAHDTEPGCAVRRAVDDGAIGSARVASYRKLVREALSRESDRRY